MRSVQDTLADIDNRRDHLTDDALAQTLFDDYVRRTEHGQEVEPEVYFERFPSIRHLLQRYFEVHRAATAGDLDELADAWLAQDDGPAAGDDDAEELVLGDFRLVGELARGGMGIVYEAHQVSTGRRVALKTLHRVAAIDQRKKQRFLNEAQAASTIHAAGIVPVISVGEQHGVCYFAMPLVCGADLGQVIAYLKQGREGGPHSIASGQDSDANDRMNNVLCGAGLQAATPKHRHIAVAALGATLGRALDHAHQVGVIHRDLKPSNVLLDEAGQPWISDFGLAQLESAETLTQTGDMLGTYYYMSPEQAAGQAARVDCRCDVYSLGATLYELLSLEAPFAQYGPPRLIRAVVEEKPIPLRSHQPSIPRALETIVLKAMAKDPSDRYDTAGAMADDLSRFVHGQPIHARQLGVLDDCSRWLHRHRKMAATATGLFLVLIATAFAALQFHAARLNELNQQLRQEQQQLAKLLYANNVRSAFEALDRKDTAKVVDLVRQQEASVAAGVPTGIEWSLLKQIASQYEPEMVLAGHEGSVNELALVPGKPWVVSVGDDQTTSIWNLETSEQVAEYRSDDGPLCAIAVSPDGSCFATGCKTLRLVDMGTGKSFRAITTHQHTIESIAFSPTGDQIASGSRYHQVHVNSTSGELIASLAKEARNEMLLFSSGGRLLIGSAREETSKYEFIRIWNTTTGTAAPPRDIKPKLYPNLRFFIRARDDRWIGAGGPGEEQLHFASRQNSVGTNVGMADCSEKRWTLRHCLVSRHSPDCFKILRFIVRNAPKMRVLGLSTSLFSLVLT